MRRTILHSVLCLLLLIGSPANAQEGLDWSPEDYREAFAKIDTFLERFSSLSQFRLPGGDTLCVSCAQDFKDLFSAQCLYPDLINPLWLSSGEMVMTNRTSMKSLDRFTREVKSNFPGGLIVRYRGINYNFQTVNRDYFEVVIARKTRGQVKNRWRLELADTLLIRARGLDSGIRIQSIDVLGYSYSLPDMLELSKVLRGAKPDINLRQQKRTWEQSRRKRDDSEFSPALTAVDSVAKYSPCACIDRVPSVNQYYFAMKIPIIGSSGYKRSPMIAYSDRNGNYSQVSAEPNSESFRELEFLQPFFVVDTAGEYVHLIEYDMLALQGTDFRIKRCLADYGWIRKERMIMGAMAMRNETGFDYCYSNEQLETNMQPDNKLCFRVFQNPSLGSERIEPPSAGRLYVYKQTQNAVLLGNSPQLIPHLVDETLLGWRSTKGLVWNTNHE
jgi:hypothetical protein